MLVIVLCQIGKVHEAYFAVSVYVAWKQSLHEKQDCRARSRVSSARANSRLKGG
jgi:hypothetical protein